MKTSYERITPELADKYLNLNVGNRKLRSGVAEKYAADMAAGTWTECTAPITFYANGELADGQHRLWAITESGQAQNFIVVRDFPRNAALNIDTGASRTLVDNARISGTDLGLSNQLIAYARAIEDGDAPSSRNPRSMAEMLEVVGRHRAAAEWVVHNGPQGRAIRNAVTMGAIGRAWYVENDKDRLIRFCKVLSTGFSEGASETAAVAIRNYLLARAAEGALVTTSANWRDAFLKVQNAIRYFMLGKTLMTIRHVTDESYPLAGAKLKAKHVPTTQAGKRAASKVARVAKKN